MRPIKHIEKPTHGRSFYCAARLTNAEVAQWRDLAKSHGQRIVAMNTAAAMWFESLDRTEKVKALLFAPNGTYSRSMAVNFGYRSVMVRWIFPMHGLSHCMGAAIRGFMALPRDQQAEWVVEFHVGLAPNAQKRPVAQLVAA